MAKAPKIAEQPVELRIEQLKRGRVKLRLIGSTPLYFNSMSAKSMRDLLMPAGRKTQADKASQMKHDPDTEFRSSIYKNDSGPTLLSFPAPGIKRAMARAAIETPGLKKTSVEKLVFIAHERVPIWGRPYLKMDVVRSADMNRTPDVRTRAFVPEWCAEIDVHFVTPHLNPSSIVTLLANAGLIIGIGDNRQEKGAGSFGCFDVHGDKLDADAQATWDRITSQGRDIQVAAMERPEPFDDMTRDLLAGVRQEKMRRQAA